MTKVQHILLTTLGSQGDLNPYLVLGKDLRALGFDVSLATHISYSEQVESIGLNFIEQLPSWEGILSNAEISRKLYDPKKGAEFMFRELLLPEVKNNLKEFDRHGPFDLIFSNPLTFATKIYADLHKIPCVSVVLSPISFFSPYDPPILSFFPLVNKLRDFPILSGALLKILDLYTRSWAAPIEHLRQSHGLPKMKKNPLTYGYFETEATLVLLPDFFLSRQSDWPEHRVHFAGFPFLASRKEAEREDLVVYTFGSVLEIFDEHFFEMTLNFQETHKEKALFVLGSNFKKVYEKFKDRIFHFVEFIEYAPYDVLFSRASVIVHHGGIGTIAEAMRAGTPQLIVPFTNDQPENARRTADLGIARVIAINQLDENILEEEFKKLRSDEVRKNCNNIQERMARTTFSEELKKFMSDLL